jgi:glycosyltransferase involved in cell wall biosynthesis
LFTTLGRALYQYLGKSGYVLTYGFPNGNIQNLRVTNFSGSPSALAEGAEYFKVDIPANKEALGNSGVWVKYEDVDDLSKKLLYILNNYAEMEMQKNINYQRVVEYFTRDNVSNLYIKYIKTLANA